MSLHDLGHISDTAGTAFTVTLKLDVTDARALWNAAAEKALAAPGMTLADVLDTLGPREDPSIADCIAMLAAPAAIAGCLLDDFAVEAAPDALPMAELIQLPVARRVALTG